MSGAAMNYDFGAKRHWRRWVWNRIAERVHATGKPLKDAVVLYLAGINDFDRPVALSKGFREENLIAVERDGDALFRLRKAGVLTINGDFFDVVDAVIVRRRVDVVLCDLCAGLDPRFPTMVSRWLWSSHAQNLVIAANLLRGRDALSNELRMASKALGFAGEDGKHRGLVFCHAVAGHQLHALLRMDEIDFDNVSDQAAELCVSLVRQMVLAMQPALNSYRSLSGQTFDSVVLMNPHKPGVARHDNSSMVAYREFMKGARREFGRSDASLQAAGRSAAAVFAHRTMRSA